MGGIASGLAITSLKAAEAKGKIIDAHGHLTHHSRADWQTTDRKIIDIYALLSKLADQQIRRC
jgi:hypothetical protein